MPTRWSDCHCEDYPCCGHYDSIDPEPYYCDTCGYEHSSSIRCQDDDYDPDDDEWDDEDEQALVRVNAFGQRIRDDAPELPGDHYESGPFDD